MVHGFYSPEQGWPVARAAAEHALALDPELPEAHQALGAVHYFYDWDWRKAEAEFLWALRLNPSYPEARRLYARLLMSVGRDAEGHAQMLRAEKIDPAAFLGSRAFGLILAGRHEEVVREYFTGEKSGRSPLIYQVLATAFEVTSLFRESVDAMVEALSACDQHARAAEINLQWEAGGYDAVLHWLLEDLLARQRQGYTSPLLLAEMYARLAKPEEMFYWLDAAGLVFVAPVRIAHEFVVSALSLYGAVSQHRKAHRLLSGPSSQRFWKPPGRRRTGTNISVSP